MLVYLLVTQARPHLRLVSMYFMALVHCSSLLNCIFTEKVFPLAGSRILPCSRHASDV